MSKSQKAAIGMHVLFFIGGSATPFSATVASIDGDRVHLSYIDGSGTAQTRQNVPFSVEPIAAGDYATPAEDADAAIEAHAKAMKEAKVGQPAPDTRDPKVAAEQERTEKAAQARGDFSSAAHASDNVQPAGRSPSRPATRRPEA